ncbi:MAG TPA: cadherin-like beta sandwich domain-containing protein, partial [Spirochaetota bacterium]|nr:cadherin-like beta sandwich domain-containing protein [Spirochaetota bacterium]
MLFFGVTVFFVLFNSGCSNPQIAPTGNNNNNNIFQSDNADLNDLILLDEKGVDLQLVPKFDKDIVSYKVYIDSDVGSVSITPTISDKKKASAFVEAMDILDKATLSCVISGDSKVIEIKVIAQDKSEKIYKITILRKGNIANLKGITVDNGSLSPIFKNDTYDYNLTLANSVSSCKITPVLEDSGAQYQMSLDDKKVDNGSSLNLKVGNNILKIDVTSRDGSTKQSYKVTINRAAFGVSNIVNLSSITLSNGILSPAFDKNVQEYNVTLGLDVTSVNVTADKEDAKSTVTFSPSVPMGLIAGKNTLKITVKAEDGVNTKDYIVNFNVQSTDTNALLANLSFEGVTLDPVFSKNVFDYKSTVANSVTKTKVTYQSDVNDSTVEFYKGGVIANNSEYQNLSEGDNLFEVKVKSKNGSLTNTYKTVVKRQSLNISSNAFLSSLVLKKASDNSTLAFTPSFDKNTTTYNITVANAIDLATVVPTVEETGKASVSVNGIIITSGASSNVSLSVGDNQITIEVKAEDGTTKKNYYLNINRESVVTTTTTTTTTIPITDRIILHAKNYGWVYLWETSDTGLNSKRHKMTDEGNSWSTKTIMVTSAKLIFTPADSWDGKTADLTRTAGEWWYKDGNWTDYNPDAPKTPVITATPTPKTYLTTQNVTLAGSNSNDDIYYTLDGSTPSGSSTKYSTAIEVSSSKTIKAIGYNAGANPQWGSVYSFSYVIDPNADFVAPTITPSKEAGIHPTAISVNFNIKDNKSGTTKVYYTTDGTNATVNSTLYIQGDASGSGLTGSNVSIALNEGKTINILAVDAAGNETKGNYYYYCGVVTTTRFDPRQESIYFLLTSRWFDGDTSNSVGDEWCSYTQARVTPGSPQYVADNGFTGPDDVTWRGDFKGLVEKMDYIKALGFTAIWITPIVQNRSPLAYHGYHGWDFTKEDRRLESAGYNFQRVVNEAHARGMKICLDIVINHSGRYGIKDFAEIKYNTDTTLYPMPTEWSGWTYGSATPNNWTYDGLTSPGTVNGVSMPAYQRFGDIRPFSAADVALYPNLLTDK